MNARLLGHGSVNRTHGQPPGIDAIGRNPRPAEAEFGTARIVRLRTSAAANRRSSRKVEELTRADGDDEPARDHPGCSGSDTKSAFEFAESTGQRRAAGGRPARRFMGSLHDSAIAHWDHDPHRLTPARSPNGGKGARRAGEAVRLMGRLVCVGVGLFLWLIGIPALQDGLAQTLTIRPIKDFKVPDYYPNPSRGGTNQLRTLLTGVEARPRPDGRVFVKEPHILSFTESGKTQLVVRAVECVFDYKTKSASSTNTLQFQTGDGSFYLKGQGFHWNQTNSNLIISNNARTRISRPLVESTSPESSQPSGTAEPIEITADEFTFISESKLATWQGNVRAKDPQLNITCWLLTAKLAVQGGKPESIVAETNVVLKITETNGVTTARGDKAVYSADRETLVLSGLNASLESQASHIQMWSPAIAMDLTNKILKANGSVRTRIPSGAFGKMSEVGLNPKPTGPKPAVEENTEIVADDFELISETKLAVWRGNVRAIDPKFSLACELLNVKLASAAAQPGRAAKPERIVAETNVLLSIIGTDGKTIAKGDKAVYLSGEETLALSGKNPTLEIESARLQMWSPDIMMNLTNKTLKAKGPVRTKLPSGTLGRIGEVGSSEQLKGARPVASEESAEVLADRFEFNSESKLAIWEGNVRAKDAQSKIICELLTAKLAGERGQLETIVAEGKVLMTISETNGVTTARGDKAVYTAGNQTLVLYGNDALLESKSPEMRIWSSHIAFDLQRRKLKAHPPVRGTISPGALRQFGQAEGAPLTGQTPVR